MKKRIMAVAAGLIFVFSVPAGAYPPIQVYVDGASVSFDQAPVIIDDRTLVPMRAIFNALGCEVTWVEATQSVISTKGSDTIVFQIGKNELYKNGELAYTMPVPARIMGERTMVPLRAVAEAVDAEVEWDGVNYVVRVYSNGQADKTTYSQTVTADDGTVVLNFKMDCPKSVVPAADEIYESLTGKAEDMGDYFISIYGSRAVEAYEKAKATGESFSPYYCVGSFEMTREDSNYVSFFGTTTQYIGGEQDERGCSSYTYDSKTGDELELSEIIDDNREELNYFWNISFRSLISAAPESFYSDAETRLDGYLDNIGFYLTKDGIGFYLAPRTIAPNETGIISFTVQYQL